MPKPSDIKWWARGGYMERMGPFATQEDAAEALITTEGRHIEGAFVWPERVKTTRRLKRMGRVRDKLEGKRG